MFTSCLSRLPARLGEFVPCPPTAERAAWETCSETMRALLLQRGEKALCGAWNQVLASDWLRFSRTGERADFEHPYFARRRRLNDLILAECIENTGRYLDSIVDGIWLLCEESAWQVPAHNSYIRDTPQLPMPNTRRPVLDLFSCETGALLALAHYLLRDKLDAVSPFVSQRIRDEVEKRILTPYLTDHFWWMGNGDEPMCNWTTWCTQNVLLAFFCLPVEEAKRRQAVCKAAASLDCFLKDYGPDGCCNEGAQYYRAAGLCLCQCLEILCAAAPEAFEPLWQEEKLRNIVSFILYMHVDGPYYINFADCSPLAGPCGAREFLFARRTGCTPLMDLAAADWQTSQPVDAPMRRVNLFYLVQELFAVPLLDAHIPAPVQHGEVWYPSAGVWVGRDARLCTAVKAGCNADSHNHNDTGSITVYKNGQPFLIDIGVGSYCRKTFSPQRYEIWTMQSAWHNLPTFDGVMEQDGPQFAARAVESTFGPQRSSISMELADAWPAGAHLDSYRRTVVLEKGQCLTVLEECSGDYAQAWLSFLFARAPHTVKNRIETELGCIAFSGAEEIRIEEVPIDDLRLQGIWGERIWRAVVRFDRRLQWTLR